MLYPSMVKNTDDQTIVRLKRIEGQIGGIIRMYNSGRNCEEIFQQIKAVRSSLDSLSVSLLKSEVCSNVSSSKKEKAGIMLDRLLKI